MKKGLLKIALVGCITFGFAACSTEDTDELNVGIVDTTSNPDDFDPDCDDPNGC